MPFDADTLPEPDARLVDALARDLASAGYSGEGVRALLGDDAASALARMSGAPARRAARSIDPPLATLVLALWLGDPVSVAAWSAALPSLQARDAATLGIATVDGDLVTPRLVIRPWTCPLGERTVERWIASDRDELAGTRPLPPDHVMGVGGATRTLAALLPPLERDALDLAADLGTGSGAIALALRGIARRVIATDVSPRALWLTRLNASLNAVDGIETRLGSLFDPLEGERVDLLASNPPFVIAPPALSAGAIHEYRSADAEGDGLMRAVISRAAEHLVPDGVALLLGNWEHRHEAAADGAAVRRDSPSDRAGLERVRSWSRAGADADLWVLERERLSPVSYAELWARDGGALPGDDAFAALVHDSLDDFDRRGVEAVGLGWVVLRRARARAVLDRIEAVPQHVALDHVGAHLAVALDAADWLATHDDDALLDARLRVAPDVTEARHQLPGAAGPRIIELRQGGGLGRSFSVDPALAGIVGACDGELPLGVLVEAVADLLDVDAAALRHDLVPRIRELVFAGVLLPDRSGQPEAQADVAEGELARDETAPAS